MALDARADRPPAHRPRPGRRRRHARLPGGERRAGQPVLVLPPGRRAPPDVPPRPADADVAGPVPVRRRPLRVLRAVRRRPQAVPHPRRVDGDARRRGRPQRAAVRGRRLPPGELRAHPGARRGVLPPPGRRRRLPRRPGPRPADRVAYAPDDLFDDEHLPRQGLLRHRRARRRGAGRVPRPADAVLGVRPGADRAGAAVSASTPTRYSTSELRRTIIGSREEADHDVDGTAAGPRGRDHRRHTGDRQGHRRGVPRRGGQGRRQRPVGGEGRAGARRDGRRRARPLHRLRRQGPRGRRAR